MFTVVLWFSLSSLASARLWERILFIVTAFTASLLVIEHGCNRDFCPFLSLGVEAVPMKLKNLTQFFAWWKKPEQISLISITSLEFQAIVHFRACHGPRLGLTVFPGPGPEPKLRSQFSRSRSWSRKGRSRFSRSRSRSRFSVPEPTPGQNW
jgi:hypothetical protein